MINLKKNKHIETFIHVIAWILIFGFPLVFMDRESGINWNKYIRHSIVPVGYFIVFYANYLYLVPQFLFKEKNRQFLILNLALVLVMTFLSRILWNTFDVPPPPEKLGFEPPRYIFILRDFVMMLFVAGLGAAIRISMRWRHVEAKLVESEQQKTAAELQNLKNQLNPHFLLNTLNNIYALIAFDSDKAQEAVMELSRLLRYMLYENQTNVVPLNKEFDFIKNYVALMRIRLTENVQVDLSLEEEPNSHIQIAPFIFISLIENAFKHGVSPTEDSFVTVRIIGRANGEVKCDITNSNFPKSDKDKSGSGIGLEQVQKRLDLMYPGKYDWQKSVTNNHVYSSILTIQTA